MEVMMIFLWFVGFLYTWGYAPNPPKFTHLLACLFLWPMLLGTMHSEYMNEMVNKDDKQ